MKELLTEELNGISLIITIGIIAGLPGAFFQELGAKIYDGGLVILLVEMVILLFVILLTILLVQGTRRSRFIQLKELLEEVLDKH